nr:MAG TPA: hypothetical protein [Caudoviricetes sp.]
MKGGHLPSLHSMLHNIPIVCRFLILHCVLVFEPERTSSVNIVINVADAVFLVDLAKVGVNSVHCHPKFYRVAIHVVLLHYLLALFKRPVRASRAVSVLHVVQPFVRHVLSHTSGVRTGSIAHSALRTVRLVTYIRSIPHVSIIVTKANRAHLVLVIGVLVILRIFHAAFRRKASVRITAIIPHLRFAAVNTLIIVTVRLNMIVPIPHAVMLAIFGIRLADSPFLRRSILSAGVLHQQHSGSSFHDDTPLHRRRCAVNRPQRVRMRAAGITEHSETAAAGRSDNATQVFVTGVQIKHCRLCAVAFQQRIRYRSVADCDYYRCADDRCARNVLSDYDSVYASVLIISRRNVHRQHAACVSHAL